MKQALRVAFGFLMLWAAVLHAEVRIEITQGVDSARPIGVVPFKWAGPGAAPEDIGGIVAADLRNSGKFNPLDRPDCRSSQPPLRKFSLPHGLRWVLMPSSLDRSRRIRTVPTMLLISWLTLAARRVSYWRKTLIK